MTSEFFLNLISGCHYDGSIDKNIGYSFSASVTRIVKNGWIQIGIENSTVKPRIGKKRLSECLGLKHDRPGVVGVVKKDGLMTDEIYITLQEMPYFDSQNGQQFEAFGKVIEGFHLMQYFNNLTADICEKPYRRILVSQAGCPALH